MVPKSIVTKLVTLNDLERYAVVVEFFNKTLSNAKQTRKMRYLALLRYVKLVDGRPIY